MSPKLTRALSGHAFLPCLMLVLLVSCARAPLKAEQNAMRESPGPELLSDDLALEPLLKGLEAQEKYLLAGSGELRFGPRTVTRAEYAQALRELRAEAARLGTPLTEESKQALLAWVKDRFEFWEVYGRDRWGEVFLTSYYEPVIEARRKPEGRFTRPLYGAPPELVGLDIKDFDPDSKLERKPRGRVIQTDKGARLVPYFTRNEIDVGQALKGRGLELAYVDPVDAFFTHVQGSATLKFPDGRSVRVNYADKNGHPYESLGRILREKLPPGTANLHTLERELRSLPEAERESFLDRNPSYVFFRVSNESATTTLGAEATDGRTIATDARWFPKGALAYLEFPKPKFSSDDALIPEEEGDRVSRLVMDQDTGGAIQGGGRLDLFWGRGAQAQRYAGVMQHTGKLWYLIPRKKPAL